MNTRLRHLSPALSLALLFGWLLAFPMFGPWLVLRAGVNTGLLALWFIAGHMLGLLLTGTISPRVPRHVQVAVLSTGTVIYGVFSLPPIFGGALLFVLGVVIAELTVSWTEWFATTAEPHVTLAVAMVGANVILAVACLPVASHVLPFSVLTALPLLALVLFPKDSAAGARPASLASDPLSITKSVWALGAFAIAVFFIGGVWYREFALPALPSNSWTNLFDICFYMLGIVLLAWWVKHRGDLASIAAITLSCLGLGLLLAHFGGNSLGFTSRVLLSLGLAGGDYYYWISLWLLGGYIAPRKVFGWGLGFSVFHITLATLVGMYGVLRGYSRDTLFLIALGFTVALLPLIFNSRFGIAPAVLPKQASSPPPPLPPTTLTDTEAKVFALLTNGASDQDIADKLLISRNTVKFHVRNILHKYDVPNRKVLLSRLNRQEL